MGTNRWVKYKIEQLPIKIPTDIRQEKIKTLVDKIIIQKKSDHLADKSSPESEIDSLVYELYGLTDEEIRIVEEGR